MNAEIIVDAYWVNFALAVVLPMVVAVVTKRLATGAVKAVVLTLLTVVASILQTIVQADGRFTVQVVVVNFVVTFVTAVATHFGLLQPLRVTGKAGVIQEAVPGGVGASVSDGNSQNVA
jgi:hypothetical protein